MANPPAGEFSPQNYPQNNRPSIERKFGETPVYQTPPGITNTAQVVRRPVAIDSTGHYVCVTDAAVQNSAAAVEFIQRLGAVLHVQLFVDVVDVLPHGIDTD